MNLRQFIRQAGYGLSRHFETGARKVIPQPAPRHALVPRDGFDLHQFARELDDVYKIASGGF